MVSITFVQLISIASTRVSCGSRESATVGERRSRSAGARTQGKTEFLGMSKFDAEQLTEELRVVFATGKTKAASWRLEQLKGLARLAQERVDEINAALQKDLNKPIFETYIGEIQIVEEAANDAAKYLKKWMTPEKVSTSLVAHPSRANIISEPLGVTLIISAWNYPFLLSLDPMIGAIAAGNAVVLKPSELAPATSALLAKLVPMYVDSSAIRIVEGGVAESTALLEQRWDKIFYTGSTRVGKIVLTAAAKHLTPVTLELGGKSPVIIDSTADMDVVAKRLAWGKWASNNGQACIAADYVLAEESIVPKLISKLKDHLKKFYGEDPSISPDISRVVNLTHFKRLVGLLQDEKTADKIVYGGQHDEKALFIEPSILLDPPLDSPIMQEEIFGPLLPIITVKNVDQAISIVNSRSKPLALYLFSTNDNVVKHVLSETSSGGVTVNDIVLHVTQRGLPFGGVGDSGLGGGYHGKHSFDTFSHKKSVLYRKLTGDAPFRYPPYTEKKLRIITAFLNGNIFNVIRAFLGF